MINTDAEPQLKIPLKRDSAFDILKLISAFLIIVLHTTINSNFGPNLAVITRMAVPAFYLITGYYYDRLSTEKKRLQILKILKLLVFSTILYFVIDVVLELVYGNNPIYFLKNTFTLNNLFLFITVNESPFASHLWYLSSILYILVILHFTDKAGIWGKRILFILTPILLTFCLILGTYSFALFHLRIYYIFTRNFLLTGLPFVCIGRFLYSKHDLIKTKIHDSIIILLIVMGLVLSYTEKLLLDKNYFTTYGDMYIGTLILSIACFLLCIKHPCQNNENLFAIVGRKLTLDLFIYHQIFNSLFAFIAQSTGIYNTYVYFAPFIVFGVTLLLILTKNKIKQKLK